MANVRGNRRGVTTDNIELARNIRNTAGVIAYWNLQEATGTNAVAYPDSAMDGTHTSVDVGIVGNPVVGNMADYDGTNSVTNIYSAALNTALNRSKGSLEVVLKIPSAAWTDGTQRFAALFFVNGSNFIAISEAAGNNTLLVQYAGGGVTKQVGVSTSTTAIFHVVITWDTVEDEMKVYIDGVQSGATQTGMTIMAGNLSATQTVIGALNTTPNNSFSGSIAHVVLSNRALSAAEIGHRAYLAGVA
jgi:hypothetical protein